MRLKSSFVRHEIDGQALIVPTGAAAFHGLVQGNKTLAAIAECLTRDTSEEEIVEALSARFEGSREDMRADVAAAVKRLRELGAIDD